MAAIYSLKCRLCGFSPELDDRFLSGVVGFVATSDVDDGAVLPDGYLAFRRADGVIVELPHPLEESVLRANGGSFREASRSGNLFGVTYKVCRDCGVLNEERQVRDSRIGCLFTVSIASVTFLVTAFGFGWHPAAATVAAWAASAVAVWISETLDRRRWAAVNESLRLRCCPSCGSADLATFHQLMKKPARCPGCRTANLTAKTAGIS